QIRLHISPALTRYCLSFFTSSCDHRHLPSFPTRRSSDLLFRPHGTPDAALLAHSDGYATGLIVYTLRKAGLPGDHPAVKKGLQRSEEHTSELLSRFDLVCRLLLEKKKKKHKYTHKCRYTV